MTFKEITVSNNSISIPEGYIVDYIDSKFRKDTPEEYVRQNIEKRLVNEHRYLHKQIKIEMPIKMGSQKPRVDIAIFKNELEEKQEQIYMIVECKSESIEPTNRKEGVEQLKSYMAACLNCEWGMWTNGKVKTALKKTRQQKGEIFFEEINDIPSKDGDLTEIDRPKRESLKYATEDNLNFLMNYLNLFNQLNPKWI